MTIMLSLPKGHLWPTRNVFQAFFGGTGAEHPPSVAYYQTDAGILSPDTCNVVTEVLILH